MEDPNVWLEMDGQNGNPKSSRFQVAKVDFVNENPMMIGNGDEDEDPLDRHDSLNSPTVTHQSSYETKNLKSLRHYTREALPRADNYRNILSVHGHAERPTLEELHSTLTDGSHAKVGTLLILILAFYIFIICRCTIFL